VKTEFMDELLTLTMRYQPPAGGQSTLMTFPVKDSQGKFGAASQDFQFATAVASFGMLLRNSNYKGDTSFAAVLETANASKGEDKLGYRAEFIQLVQAAQRISGQRGTPIPADWNAGRRANSVGLNFQSFPAAAQPQVLVQTYPAAVRHRGFTMPTLFVGIIIGVAACLIALAVIVGLAGIWNHAPAPRHLIAGISPLPKLKR
jgi:hypothetical protein